MKKLVFDSYALIAFFKQEPGFEVVRDFLVKTAKNEYESHISVINVGEIYYMVSRKSNTKMAEAAISALLQMPVIIHEADLASTLEAASLKAKYSLSYADAFAACLSINKKAILITGDLEFEALRKEPEFKIQYI